MASPRAASRRQGVGRTPQEREADACGKRKTRRCLARAGETSIVHAQEGRGSGAHMKSRGYTPARARPLAAAPIEREEMRRGGREEGGGGTWNPAGRRLHPVAPACTPHLLVLHASTAFDLRSDRRRLKPSPADSWLLPLLCLASTPPCLLPNPRLQPLLVQWICNFFLFPNQSGRTPFTPPPTSSWFFLRLSDGVPPPATASHRHRFLFLCSALL